MHAAFEAGKCAGKADARRSMRACRTSFSAWRVRTCANSSGSKTTETYSHFPAALRGGTVRGGKGGGWGGESSSESGEEEDASGYEAYDARFRVLLDNKGLAKPRYKVCVNLLYMHSRVHIP